MISSISIDSIHVCFEEHLQHSKHMHKRIQKIQLKVNLLQDRHPYLEDIRGHLKVLTLRDLIHDRFSRESSLHKLQTWSFGTFAIPTLLIFSSTHQSHIHQKNKSITNISIATNLHLACGEVKQNTQGPHSGGLRWTLMSSHFRIQFNQNHLAIFNRVTKKSKKTQAKQLADG